MNYESMSDFEINRAVALIKFDGCIPYFDECEGKSMVNLEAPLTDDIEFDPCNNPAYAWPIMLENGIAPLAEKRRIYGATTDTYEYYEPHGNVIYSCEDKNPLRAAMIVFLMMSES